MTNLFIRPGMSSDARAIVKLWGLCYLVGFMAIYIGQTDGIPNLFVIGMLIVIPSTPVMIGLAFRAMIYPSYIRANPDVFSLEYAWNPTKNITVWWRDVAGFQRYRTVVMKNGYKLPLKGLSDEDYKRFVDYYRDIRWRYEEKEDDFIDAY